jgi:putative ABC transport system permease protein
MNRPPMWRRYLRLLGPDVSGDVDDEVQFHLEMRTRDLIARGMAPEEARAEALRRFGSVDRVRRECEQMGQEVVRTAGRREWWAGVRRDLLHALRVLWRSPGFAFVAVLTLALGIGANTAVFSVVHTVLFRPLPVEGLDRLVVIREDLPDLNLLDAELAPAEVLDLSARRDVFEAVSGFRAGDRTLTSHQEPTRISTAETLGDFAGVFGARPHLGRLYGPEHSTDGPHEVAVVSYGLWQQLSGGDPSFVGRTIQLNGTAHEVVGVMPPDFRYPRQVQVWVPFKYTDRWKRPQARGSLFMTTVARLRPGVTPEQLSSHLRAEVSSWNEQYHSGSGVGKVLSSTDFVEYIAGPLRLILLVLGGAVAFVLVIAAANVASLQLVRTAGRAKEIAVRSAMGAGRGRIVRQLLIESAVLALLGGLLGLGIGTLALKLLEQWEPAQQMDLTEISLDPVVLALTGLIALLTALAFGTIPALRASRVHPQEVLRESTRGASAGLGRSRLLRTSVIVQIALALVLLLGSGLMIRTLSRLLASDPGFDPAEVTTAQLSVAGSAYDTPERRPAFFDELLERVRTAPGVESAALVSDVPFDGQNDSSPFDILDRAPRPGEPERHAEASIVSPGYFSTMGIPLLRGREFDVTERPGSPVVALIDRTFAEQFFPGEDPVGRQIRGYTGDPTTIIGVVERVDHDEIGDAPKAVAYYSFSQQPSRGARTIVIRSAQPVEDLTRMLRSVVTDLDPNVPLYDIQTMEDRIERSLGPRRLAMLALGAFAVLSLLLAALGVYGVIRYTTKQRTHEIGIRLAIGAQPKNIVGLVLRQGMVLTVIGLGLGIGAALAVTRLMTGILFGVSPHDPTVFAAATALLASVALVATGMPAFRATRVDPVEVLRGE